MSAQAARPRGTLVIPVESQARELDPKLLLACVAASRGFSSVIGSRTDVDFRVGRVPRGLYVAKSLTVRSRKVFRILRDLGHEIVAWDEEALVPYPHPEIFYGRRLAPVTLDLVSHLFAWGDADAELFRKYPGYRGTPIHVTGNPRGDLLRPELRAFFEDEARAHRAAHGDFLLVNTNFGNVNAFYPVLNLLQPPDEHGRRELGLGAVGMTRIYAEGRAAHKQALFEAFGRLIPFLHDAFPRQTLVVRPHPVENPQVYREIAARHPRVRVVTEAGSPVPWLLAARALVHNGCTTGLEAWCLGRAAVAYRPVVSEAHDDPLPNALSHSCFDPGAVRDTLEAILAGELGRPDGEALRARLDHHLAARSGPLACERIVDVLERVADAQRAAAPPPLPRRLRARVRATRRRLKKTLRARRPDSKNRPEFQRHRYPGLGLPEMRARVDAFRRLLGHPRPFPVSRLSEHVFRIDP